jgi:hypothetical protein
MNFKRFVLFFTFLAIFTMAFRVSVDSDTWWHLRAGAEILERRALLTEDPFSQTRYQESWRYPGWLAQVMIYGLYSVFGYAGLNLFTALMVTIAFAWVWGRLEGSLLLRSALILLAAITSGVYWSARPQILSLALAGFFIFLLEREKAGTKISLGYYLLGMALWANLHGGFAIGFLLLGAYLGGDSLVIIAEIVKDPRNLNSIISSHGHKLRRYAFIILASLIGLCLNPHGPVLILYPFKTVSIGILQDYIQEWQTPNFHLPGVQPFLVMLLLAFLSFSKSKNTPHPSDFLLVLGFGFLSFWAARNIATFALAGIVPISRAIQGISFPPLIRSRSTNELDARLQRWMNALLAIVFTLAAALKIALPANNEYNQKVVDETYPSAAISFIAQSEINGPLFNSYNWGAYVIWKLYPEYRSFVDGRTDLFNDEILEQYLLAWRGSSQWKDVFDQWDIRLVLLEADAPLAQALRCADWKLLYEDEMAVVFKPPLDH